MNYERNWRYILSLLEAVYSRDPLTAYEKASDDEKDCWSVFAPLLERENIFVQDVYLSGIGFALIYGGLLEALNNLFKRENK